MPRPDNPPLDPEIVTTLEAIDATLAGEAVDPRHADLAELALLLAADRPVIEEGFARLLDEQVQNRTAPAPAKARRTSRRRRVHWSFWAPAGAVAASLIAAVVIVANQAGGGSSSALGTPAPSSAAGSATTASKTPATAAPSHSAPRALGLQQTLARKETLHSGSNGGAGASGAYGSASTATTAAGIPSPPPNGTLQPPTAGRRVIQGAQLSLSTSPKRVDQVSQEVFNVVGQQNGIVKSSNVTSNGAHGGYAQFLLSVPSSNLSRTMAALSTLPYANVTSRTDATQDVTNQYRFEQQRLNDARALHTSLLKQLANATTQAQIDSLTARIHDVEAQISSDEAALHSLQRSISYSQINLAINSGSVPVPVHHSGGFTLGRAAHDAGRVLTVAAGVALIVLAALLPVGLLLALLWWIGRAVRRRSRQQALDLA